MTIDTTAVIGAIAGVGGINLFAQGGHLGGIELVGVALALVAAGVIGVGASLARDAGVIERRVGDRS